ncbi:Molybdopterin molybdenumtransferase [Pseudobythopirellula maris]|uniref:Molybdopterin molybdenumtransferase n=1 Tax=Pseudobythopirellula maris TaxID=2527991 RepID=A0A5C5ZP31_9BACT|nr:gephyrin-like molybdotransferase Glp [Pseudobythopirellula maris]TWT88677.1 Molybdopterin molybdenumtransferase [Pseudobythopirellula maris]
MSELLTVDEALALVTAEARSLEPRRVALKTALGCLLAEEAVSDVDSPPHDKAMMDGFAVVASDTSAEREVVETVMAGAVPTVALGPGQATRIMTGAPLPAGADAVIPVERSETLGEGRVRFLGPTIAAGKHVMRRGESVAAGDVVVAEGARVRPIEIAVLAEAGCAEPSVVPAPRVAVLSTGDELVGADQKPRAGQIRNSNGPMLVAAVRDAGATPLDLGAAVDTPQALRLALGAGLARADVLLLSGGVSAGDKDLVPGLLAELGVRKVFHKVAVKPGKPLWFGVRDASENDPSGAGHRCWVFGLPGNPVSSLVGFSLFVRPLLAALGGAPFVQPATAPVRLARAFSQPPGRETYLPARVDAGVAQVLPWRGSADIAALAGANALLRVPAAGGEFAAGQQLDALLI